MASKITKYSSIICLALTILFMGYSLKNALSEKNTIRIAVLKDAKDFTLSIRGKYRFIDPVTNKEIERGRRLRKSKVIVNNQGIRIRDTFYHLSRIKIMPRKDVTIYSKGEKRRYRGMVEIIRNEEDKLLVINSLDLETYIKGVLYHEVSHRWPLEALKAQAVATRTYALYQAKMNKNNEYDVTSDIYSQVYGGRSAERYRTNMAANRTKGQVLLYKGEVLPAYFHATCGGHTEDVNEIWEQDLPPLRGKLCQYCKLSPHYRWKKNFRSKDVQDALNHHGYKLGLIKDIKVLKRNHSGRIKDLQIKTRDGQIVIISGKEFRAIVGPNRIKSNLYDVIMKGYYFDLRGKGWGHGVGMCQWGAYFMSRKGINYKDILNYYYPGVRIVSN
jgi:stage II sporulation protein D